MCEVSNFNGKCFLFAFHHDEPSSFQLPSTFFCRSNHDAVYMGERRRFNGIKCLFYSERLFSIYSTFKIFVLNPRRKQTFMYQKLTSDLQRQFQTGLYFSILWYDILFFSQQRLNSYIFFSFSSVPLVFSLCHLHTHCR